VLNANKNLLTRCQDTWYDFAFNIQKCCESSFGSVTCCSGCLAGYRRAHIEKFVPYWMRSTVDCSDDRELTSYIIAPAEAKRALIDYMPKSKFAEKLLRDASQYDDAEDRILTANALVRSDAVYVASAIVYTDVPETFRKFTRQQERWKKGYLRTNFYVSTFFWKRNPLMAMLYYTEYAASFITPFIALGVTVFQPLVLGHYWMPLMFAALLVLKGFLLGIDYRLRDPNSKNWKYNVLMSMLSQFVVSWMLIPALLHIRNNRWGTR
jgi:hyaluronan synthase